MQNKAAKRPGRVTHRIGISPNSFAVVAKAVHNLTIERERFQSFSDVIKHATIKYNGSEAINIDALFPNSIGGRIITLTVQLDVETNQALDRIKNDLTAASERHCGAGDAMVFCAALVADLKISACIEP